MISLAYKKYNSDAVLWNKWRLAFEGGDRFIRKFLKKFSSREDNFDFLLRRSMTYSPSFAKEAIIDIRNAIFQRMVEVKREGSPQYLAACRGEGLGVDKLGTSMTQFIGQNVLDELLVMAKVGVWVDAGKDRKPYLYVYPVEDILNWDDECNPTTVLLRELEPQYDKQFGVQLPPKTVYRHAQVKDGKTIVTMYDDNKKALGDPIVLDFDRLPFVVLSIKESLMKDISNYQVALLNIASSDMNYTLRANFPFYTEQYDSRAETLARFNKSTATPEYNVQSDTEAASVDVGVANGRKYPIGAERPGFIAPPTEPLQASMAKQDQLKEEIRILVSLSLSNISPTRASQESKKQDETGLEAGLSCIGQELERAEKMVAWIWGEYVGDKTPTNVLYPNDYSLKTDSERQAEALADLELVPKLSSVTAQRELVKRAVNKLFGGKLSSEQATKILNEIEAASVLAIDPITLTKDLENFLVSPKYASMLRGYPAGESEAAAEAHVEKLTRIAEAQSLAAILTQDAAQDDPEEDAKGQEEADQEDEADSKAGIEEDTPGKESTKTEKDKKKSDPMEVEND